MARLASYLALILVITIGCASHRMLAQVEPRYRVFFPSLVLDSEKGERVESVEMEVSCGMFRVITVPDDWSASVVSPVSEVTRLEASDGHGSSTLLSLQEFDGGITISVGEQSCFSVSAVVVTTEGHRYQLARSELRLKP